MGHPRPAGVRVKALETKKAPYVSMLQNRVKVNKKQLRTLYFTFSVPLVASHISILPSEQPSRSSPSEYSIAQTVDGANGSVAEGELGIMCGGAAGESTVALRPSDMDLA